ncbi:MAG: hypothetical protein KF760_28080 [Candidatus Eremiobacteraeota bacterium]|nr:hypothetical protein [Candidatus Eremiobacteraeota bacterium]MCW5872041.1 hypothetical protein [Candidatus Eremiobacteraeota bacterium]
MKKVLILFAVLLVFAFAALVISNRASGGQSIGTGSAADRSQLEQMSLKFMEDLRFKDFQHAASYHSVEDRKKVNIPQLIEQWFAVKPETLDIMRYEIQKVDIDSTGKRGRVKIKTVLKILNANQIKEPEMMLYFFKDPAEGWIMELESSLR